MAGTGTAVLNFGSAPGTNQVSLAVTGQGSIVGGSLVEAWLSPTPTATRNLEEIKLLSAGRLGVLAHTVVAATGFTITATTDIRLTGTLNVNWVWA
jgi:hypothetical protein